MFSKCNTLSELNAARVKACAEGTPIVEVNNAYNKRKQEILTTGYNYTRYSTVPVQIEKPGSYISTLLYKGKSSKPGVIQITKDGVYA